MAFLQRRASRDAPRARDTGLGARARAWHRLKLRRLLAACAAALATLLIAGPGGPRALGGDIGAPVADVVVTTRAVATGHVFARDDLQVRSLPRAIVPETAAAALDDVVGRTAAGPAAPGEVVTRARLRGAATLPGEGVRAVHIPLVDPAAGSGVAAGDHVDVVAVADGALVAADVIVLATDRPAGEQAPPASAWQPAAEPGRGVTLAVAAEKVGAVVGAALGGAGGGRSGVHIAVRRAGTG